MMIDWSAKATLQLIERALRIMDGLVPRIAEAIVLSKSSATIPVKDQSGEDDPQKGLIQLSSMRVGVDPDPWKGLTQLSSMRVGVDPDPRKGLTQLSSMRVGVDPGRERTMLYPL
jgi:hypothetical protein